MPRKSQNKHKVLFSTKWGDLVVKESRNTNWVDISTTTRHTSSALSLDRFQRLYDQARQVIPSYSEYMSVISGTTTD